MSMSTLLTLKRFVFEVLLGFLLYKINAKQLVYQPCNLFILLSVPSKSFFIKSGSVLIRQSHYNDNNLDC